MPSCYQIRAILYNQNTPAPAALGKYTGTYRLTENFSVAIAISGTSLTVQGTGQHALAMEAIKENTFYVKGPDATIEFISDDKGNITKLILHQKGQTVEGLKQK